MRKPRPEAIREALSTWETSPKYERYRVQEHILHQLFRDRFPKNDSIHAILLKVTALNQFYSTNIYDTYSMAQRILELKIDRPLMNGNSELISKIATITLSGKKKRFYSFASKYCSHHQPDHYPIYDSFVSRMLGLYRKQIGSEDFSQNDLKEYEKFKRVLSAFRNTFGLKDFSLRQIDIFLWIKGRERFSSWNRKPRKQTSSSRVASGKS